jgi:hypothetical protein
MRILGLLLIALSLNAHSEDVRHLYFDQDKADRSEIFKRIMGKDFTGPTTQTERALEDAFGEIIVVDTPNFLIEPLPDSVQLYAADSLEFKEMIDLLSSTYGFKNEFIGVPEETLKKSVKINANTHNLSEVLAYLEMITGTNITVWPKGTGSTIMVAM